MAHMRNELATPEQLHRRTLRALPTELQDAVFFSTQCLTQAAGLLLLLPQSVTAQACVILARYWLLEPVMAHEFSDVSAACIYLVAKPGPCARSPRDVCNVFAYLVSSSSPLFRTGPSSLSPQQSSASPSALPPPPLNDPSSYYLSESAYEARRSRTLALEGRILAAIGFATHVALPHPLAVTYLQALDFLGRRRADGGGQGASGLGDGAARLAERAVAYLNTALLSPQMLYLTSQPPALAVAAIFNAARDVGVKMPVCDWWEVFDVDREELGYLVVGMRSVEGWARKICEDVPALRRGMVSREAIERELQHRHLHVRNGHGVGSRSKEGGEEAEAELARELDERSTHQMDTDNHALAHPVP